jgi:hypothetical protein
VHSGSCVPYCVNTPKGRMVCGARESVSGNIHIKHTTAYPGGGGRDKESAKGVERERDGQKGVKSGVQEGMKAQAPGCNRPEAHLQNGQG